MGTGSQSTAHTRRANLGGTGQVANFYLTSSRIVQGFQARSYASKRSIEWPKDLPVST